MPVLGIDPGLHGGIALLDGLGGLVGVWKMPRWKGAVDWDYLADLLLKLQRTYDPSVAVERQVPFTAKDEDGSPRVMGGTATMLENYGVLKREIVRAGLAYTEYMPAQWRTSYPIFRDARRARKKAGQGKEQARTVAANRGAKNLAVSLAASLYPERNDWTPGPADAALIARHHLGAAGRGKLQGG